MKIVLANSVTTTVGAKKPMERVSKFDGLAEDYERHRPRYPQQLLESISRTLVSNHPVVVDIGAGTGIVLDGLLPVLPAPRLVVGVDPSQDMVAFGAYKHPGATWIVGTAEDVLEDSSDVDLIVAGQSLQWMDRPRVLRAANRALSADGILAVLQNNRNHESSGFLSAYEDLLEDLSPGYRRDYRSFDFSAEIRAAFHAQPSYETWIWSQNLGSEDFIGMSRSSTQAQRAIAANGSEFLKRLNALVTEHSEGDILRIEYLSELYMIRKDS